MIYLIIGGTKQDERGCTKKADLLYQTLLESMLPHSRSFFVQTASAVRATLCSDAFMVCRGCLECQSISFPSDRGDKAR
jgi:hypothetical protein